MKLLLALLFISSIAFAEENSAWLNIDPAYSFRQHDGADVKLYVTQHLSGKWYLAPTTELFAWSTNRDINGTLDLEYHFSERLTLDAGEGYDNYQYYGEPTTITHYSHAGVKIRLW